MRSCCPMTKKILIVNGVEFRQIDTDIGKQKRAARRIPGPLGAIMGFININNLKREKGCYYGQNLV